MLFNTEISLLWKHHPMLLSSLTVGASAILPTNEYQSTSVTCDPKQLPHLAENLDKSWAALCACLSLLPREVWCIWNPWATFGHWPLFHHDLVFYSALFKCRTIFSNPAPFVPKLGQRAHCLRAPAPYFLAGACCYPWWLLPRNYWNVPDSTTIPTRKPDRSPSGCRTE